MQIQPNLETLPPTLNIYSSSAHLRFKIEALQARGGKTRVFLLCVGVHCVCTTYFRQCGCTVKGSAAGGRGSINNA